MQYSCRHNRGSNPHNISTIQHPRPVAVVGLEETFYQVSETDGVVEVCVVIYEPDIVCPIEFPFDVSLSTFDESAGKTTFHMD